PAALIVLVVPLVVLIKRRKSIGYLVSFSLFFLYLWAVFAYAVCPLPFGSGPISLLRENNWGNSTNLVPGLFLREHSFWKVENVYGNILLGMPFGFGLPFVVTQKTSTPKFVASLGIGFAAALELVQLGISAIFYGVPYRTIDIDDVLLVFVGVLLGYSLLRAIAYAYRRLGFTSAARLPVWAHFHAVLVHVAPASRTASESVHETRRTGGAPRSS